MPNAEDPTAVPPDMPPAVPRAMRAVRIREPGGPDVLEPFETQVPEPGPGEILLRIEAAGVNRPDVLQRAGSYPPPPDASPLPGLEAAGAVAALGEGVERWRVGDAVCALLAGGGYAQYATVDARHALPVPEQLSMREAAAVPETALTVWHNVFQRGGLRKGETLLVHGGSSGIGTTAIQLAVARGARVFATAGSARKCAACERLGATAINYREADFVEVVKAARDAGGDTGGGAGGGADVILDMVGGDYVARNIVAARPDGRIVQIAFLQGSKVEANLAPLMLKRLTLTGSTLRARDADFKAALTAEVERHVWPLVASGAYRPVMDEAFPLAEAARAHARMEAGDHVGKIVLDAA